MNFESLVEKLSTDENRALAEKLQMLASTSGVGYQVVTNLRIESRLDELALRDIVEGLLQADANPSVLKEAYVAACQRHILEGGEISICPPLRLGRVVTRSRYIELVSETTNEIQETELQDIFDNLHSGVFDVVKKSFAKIFSGLGQNALGKYVVWATFNPKNPAGHPFENMPADADSIRARLGLDPNEAGDELIQFVYSLPPEIKPKFPTIADAQWVSRFRPAPPELQWGLTMPWPEMDEWPPRPELVHEPIQCQLEQSVSQEPRAIIEQIAIV